MNSLRMHLRLALLMSPEEKDKSTPTDQEIIPIKEPKLAKVKQKLPSKPVNKIPKKV